MKVLQIKSGGEDVDNNKLWLVNLNPIPKFS